MNKPKFEEGDRNFMNCPDCGGSLLNVVVDGEDKLQCNDCRNFYVPLGTTPASELGRGWTDDDWEELFNR